MRQISSTFLFLEIFIFLMNVTLPLKSKCANVNKHTVGFMWKTCVAKNQFYVESYFGAKNSLKTLQRSFFELIWKYTAAHIFVCFHFKTKLLFCFWFHNNWKHFVVQCFSILATFACQNSSSLKLLKKLTFLDYTNKNFRGNGTFVWWKNKQFCKAKCTEILYSV